MRKVFNCLLIAGVIALGWWTWNFFFPSLEKVLCGKMATLAATATFDEKTNPITRAAKAHKLAGMFGAEAQIAMELEGIEPHSFAGREEISEAAGTAFAAFRSLRVEFLDVSVRSGAGKQTAEVSCTVKVLFGHSKDYGLQEMRFLFRKRDGEWFIVRVECVKTLS